MKIRLNNIAFEVTSECNLDCAYCYNHWKQDENYEKLDSYKQASSVLKQLVKTTNVSQITFTGGEPFLSERFIELVLFARIHHKKVNIISNGNVGKYEDYKKLLSLGVGLFQFPFLSHNKKTHDSLTRIQGSWENSLTSISEVQLLNGNVVPVIVLTKKNYTDLEETLLFLHGMGLTRIMLNRYNIGGKGIFGNDLALNKIEIESAFFIANKIASENQLRISSNVCSPHCYINPSMFPHIAFGNCSPDVTRRPITINIKGDVRLCNHSPIIAGNIFSNTMEEILYSDYSKSWDFKKPDFCNNCELYEKCLGGCRAASEQFGLTLNQVDPIVHYF